MIDGHHAIGKSESNASAVFMELMDGKWNISDIKAIADLGCLVPAMSVNFSIIGAFEENNRTGVAYVYEKVASSWELVT